MSYSKDFEAYPPEFSTLIERGALGLVSLNLGTPENAKRLMGRLYAFKGALKKASNKPDCPPHVRELSVLSNKSQLRVEGSNLVIRPLDLDPDAELIRAALSQSSSPAVEKRPDGQILVPINPSHLPEWLAKMAIKRAESSGS